MNENEQLLEQIRQLTNELETLKNGLNADEQTVNDFLKEFPLAEQLIDDINAVIEEKSELCGTEGLKTALMSVLIDKYRTPEQLAQDGDFLENFVFNNRAIRERIINEYIDSVSKSPNACVKRNGLPLTKAEKPSTVRAAGELARALFRK